MPWTIHQALEHEFKYRVPARFHVPPLPGEAIPPRIFTSTYFDTEHHQLGRLGLTLRRRIERSRRVWQLKIPSGPARLELEIQSGSLHIPQEFQDLLLAFFRNKEAVVLGKLRTKRKGFHIKDKDHVIAEVVKDRVSLIKDKRVAYTFQEVEIELLEGSVNQLKPFRKALIQAGAEERPLQPKIFQALQLPYPLHSSSRDSSIQPTELIRERLQAQFFQMLRHDPGTRLGRDTEALHQMRVATRRLRAILRTTKSYLIPDWTTHVRQETSWIGSLLGEVRDWDVLLEYFHRHFQDFSSHERHSFNSICKNFERQRSGARARLLEGLRSDRYLVLLNNLEDALPQLPIQPTLDTLEELTKKAFSKLQKFVKTPPCAFPISDLHRTRILLKRARYACELAEPLVGKPAKRFLQEAKVLQDLLGQHHDAMVAQERLLALKKHSQNIGTAYVTGLMVERLRASQGEIYQHIPGQWKKLQKQGKKL